MLKRIRKYLAGLSLFLWALPALGSTFNPKPAGDDMMLSILAKTIGPLVPDISGVGTGTVSVITRLLQDVNSLVLILGGLLMTYIVGSSILKTAHEGEPLGQKWSSIWIPMKAAAGAALILPVPSLGGMSAAQGIVVWLLTFAIGAGDAAWQQSIQFIAQNPVGSVVVNPVNTGQLAAGIMESQVCEMGINETADNMFPNSNPVSRVGPVPENTLNPLDGAAHLFEGYDEAVQPLPGGKVYATKYSIYQWTADSGGLLGDLSSLGIAPTACGKTAFVSGALGSGNGATLVNTVGADNGVAIGTLIGSLHPISSNIFNEKDPAGTDDANFVKAVNAYDKTMQTDIENAADTAVQSQVQAYETAAKQDGFATAGEWFWDLVQWNHIAQKTANNLGDATGIDGGNFIGKEFSSHVAHADKRIDSFIRRNGSLVGHVQPTENFNSDMGDIFGLVTPLVVDAVSDAGSNPLLAIRNVGTGMEMAGAAVYVASTGLTAGAAAADSSDVKIIPGVDNAASAVKAVVVYDVTPMALFLGGLLFVEGFFLSFVVPLIPFMVWIAALLGFLFMAFEMIVAAPLWGIMHMHPEGHEVVGMGSAGYKIALAIMVRPFLMILGLVGGYALFMGFSSLVTPMISQAVVSSQNAGGGIMGPLDMIGAVGIYVTLMVIIAYECFKLVFVLPERVMNWASSSVQPYGENDMVSKQQGAHESAKKQSQSADTAFKKSLKR